MSSWVKTRQGIWKQPDYAALAKGGSEYVLLWQEICFIAQEIDDEGALVHRLGKPWTAQQIAKKFGTSAKKVEKFLSKCVDLDLLLLENGVYSIVDHKEWYGKDEGSYRERNRERQRKYKASRSVDDHQGNVTESQQGNVTGNAVDQKRSEEEKRREDQTERGNVTEVTLPLCLPDFSESDFLEEAKRAHKRLTGKPLSKSDQAALFKTVSAGDWSAYTHWGDRAAAIIIGSQITDHRIRIGKVDRQEGNPWLYALKAAEGKLEIAADQNSTNRVAIKNGWDTRPISWDGDE